MGQHRDRLEGMSRRGFLRAGALGAAALVASSCARVSNLFPQGKEQGTDTIGGWEKSPSNPVLGPGLGTCFDVCVLKEEGTFRMWFSWRPKAAIALVESTDAVHWNEPTIVLDPNPSTDWEQMVNRPSVVRLVDGYHLWYTGQANGHSWIGHAFSEDGKSFKRMSPLPVLSADHPWEKVAVMCPSVLFDSSLRLYRMWYSGGEQVEPNAIGYATSPDGFLWTKQDGNPIFVPDRQSPWEQDRVTACQVLIFQGWHYMFYIGFSDQAHAQIGLARSRDGITGWERQHDNPIIGPTASGWDSDAVYKPYAIPDSDRWLLWYNGRRGGDEQIGLAVHRGQDLGF